MRPKRGRPVKAGPHKSVVDRDALMRWLVILLRSGRASPQEQDLAADELERLAWPDAHKQSLERDYEVTWLSQQSALVEELAEHHRKKGARNPMTLAKDDAAKVLGYSNRRGLKRRVSRYRRNARGEQG
jgi:hypothetical protein